MACDMLKLGIIGTNWITHQFVEAAIESGEYTLASVYSRRADNAEQFAEKYDNAKEVSIETDFKAFVSSPNVDVIYIASPNSLHFSQAKAAILAGKHVIVEKPLVSTYGELSELIELSEEKEVFLFEAARHIHEENFKYVSNYIKGKDKVLGANLSFMKYSSRYNALLKGEEPNIFSAKYSGGALMDLGVYLLYAAVDWFGKPKDVYYFAQKLPTGVDGLGTMILRYDGHDVTLSTGKNANSFLPSEIYFEDETLILDAINSIESITVQPLKEATEPLENRAKKASENPMIDEALAFADVIHHPNSIQQQKDYQDWIQLARDVHSTMEKLRKHAEIVFEADK